MITVAAPSPSVDITYVVPQFALGRINRPTGVLRVAGGKGLNVARAARLLDADVTAVALLGGATGEWIVEQLAADDVPVRRARATRPTRTCVSVADEGRHEMTEVYERAEPVTADEWSAFADLVTDVAADRPGWVTLSGSLPPGAPDDAFARLVAAAHDQGRAVALDAHGPALLLALDAAPDLVKVNAAEAAATLDRQAGTDVVLLARDLAARTRVGAVVTAGVDGAGVVSVAGSTHRVLSAARGAYPVGSGDCLLAALAVRLDSGADLLDAASFGTAVATANALRPGAAVFTVDDLPRAGVVVQPD